MASIGAEADTVHPVRIPDDDFFLPFSGNKSPDSDGADVDRVRRKVTSIRTEDGIWLPKGIGSGGFFLPSPISYGGFFQPSPISEFRYFDGAIGRGRRKAISIGTEVGIEHLPRMPDDGF